MGKRRLRRIAASFTVAAPSGARIRDRLRVSPADERVLALVGRHLGRIARADLAERVRIGDVSAKESGRAWRKKALTAVSSSRWAGAITRVSEDQYRLSMRCLHAERISLKQAIRTIKRRLSAPCGQRTNGVRGYADASERWQKYRRAQVLQTRLAKVEQLIREGRSSIVVGGRRLARSRHRLDDAGLTVERWREQWDATRLFLTADGESGASFGNYTISVHPDTGVVTIVLPEPLRHLANAARGRYQLECTVTFHHRRSEWLDRITANTAVRYDIVQDPQRERWYIDASWSTPTAAVPTPDEIAAEGGRLVSADLNADHLAATVVDPHGNPVGAPHTIPLDLTGPASRRDGRLRQAISDLIYLAREHGCVGIAIENLGFTDARTTGRETMGRGQRGKRFRRTVAGIPTARFRERLRGMVYHAGLLVIAVDPAYTSRWGEKHWKTPLQRQSKTVVTRHHAAAVAIGRRGLGHRVRRRPGVTAPDRRIGLRRATGQTAPAPRPRGRTRPPRTAGTPRRGGKTCLRRGEQLVLFPDLHDRSGDHRTVSPDCGDLANSGHSP
ncbi:hypothetical protein AB0L88_14330 [Saccharopolyspora shandongensis]|uniref:hypothetical protein n=1 Tax=Saccharopolyspora shandongensis TaxID=418495 RepID=UPI00344757E5